MRSLAYYGYQPVQSKTVSALGDVQLLGKYNVYQTPADAVTIKSTVILPTGVAPNADAELLMCRRETAG